MSDERAGLPRGAAFVSTGLGVSGVIHLVRPQVFEPLVPPALGDPRPWVLASGVVELACAAGMLTRRRWAPAATAATLLGVWPGNAWHAVRVQRSAKASPVLKAVVWARLPLQVPMIRAVLAARPAAQAAE